MSTILFLARPWRSEPRVSALMVEGLMLAGRMRLERGRVGKISGCLLLAPNGVASAVMMSSGQPVRTSKFVSSVHR